MSASCRNTSPGNSTIASRITRSWVTSLPEISILLTIAGCPSLIAQREEQGGRAAGDAEADLHEAVAVLHRHAVAAGRDDDALIADVRRHRRHALPVDAHVPVL